MLANSSLNSSDIDVRKDLTKNIILSGGTTMYANIKERLVSELENQLAAGAEVRVVASADRKFAVWRGASTLASLSTFAGSWITKDEYEETGFAVVHRKCA